MSDTDRPTKHEPLLPVDRSAERPLWVVLTVMAFLASLALLAANMGSRSYDVWQSQLTGAATVQLTALSQETRLADTQAALDIITATAPKLAPVRVSDDDAMALIEPWLGSPGRSGGPSLPAGITLPVLIRLSQSTPADRNTVAAALSAANIDAIVDDHSEWTADIARTSRAFRIGSWLILLVTFFAGTAATVFATHAVMIARRQIITVFAQVGASDNFITKLFIKRALMVSVSAAAVGSLSALGFITLYRLLRGPASLGLLPEFNLAVSDFILLLSLVIVFALICAVSAGISAKQLLHKHRLYT